MKHKIVLQKRNLLLLFFLLPAIVLTNCTDSEEATAKRLKAFSQSVRVVNTHEHQMNPSSYGLEAFNFYTLLLSSYLKSDLVSAGGPEINAELLNNHTADELWDTLGAALNYSSNTSYYRHLLAGIKTLYDYDEGMFTKEGIDRLSVKIAANYENYERWFDQAFRQSNHEMMIVDPWWDTFNFTTDTNHFVLVFNINNVVRAVCNGASKEGDTTEYRNTYYQLAREEGFSLHTLDEYLAFAGHLFQKAVENNIVGLKNSLAYSRSVSFEDVPFEVADRLFKKAPDLTATESKQLQDFIFHWLIRQSVRFDLPVQIHTGYLAGNGNWPERGNPLLLNNLFLQYPEARFVLFHGGYPWTGEFIALGKMFANVSLDLVWLPQISKERAVAAFDEMLDCVPYNKIFWGGDCQLIEESVGALEFGQDVVTQVLAKRVAGGSMSEKMAQDIILKIFRENAIRHFRLERKTDLPRGSMNGESI